MRIAFLADIHGNLPALIAVMAELERLQPDQVVLDGDLINAVPFSCEVIDLVRSQPWAVVRGNHEFYYLDHGTERAPAGTHDADRWGQLHWLVNRIQPHQGAYLALLPDELTIYVPGAQPLRVAHGVPGRNRVGFYRSQADSAVAAEIGHVREATLITAHTHVQFDRHIRVDVDDQVLLAADPHSAMDPDDHPRPVHRHWHVINPGSVGLPLDGQAKAHFAIVEQVAPDVEPGGWRAAHYQVSYDRRPALAAFHTTGMLAAGGVISTLFYWELVTGEPEIIRFYRWAFTNGRNPDTNPIAAVFAAYVAGTGRDQYVRARDPLT